MHLDQTLKLETELGDYIRTRRWAEERMSSCREDEPHMTHIHSNLIFKRIVAQLSDLEDQLSIQPSATAASSYLFMEAIRDHLEDLMDTAAGSDDMRLIEVVVYEMTGYIRTFRALLHQAGFQLTTEFITRIAHSNRKLPYEASNTLRRLFLQVNPDRGAPFSVASQTLFVSVLDEALGVESNLPESITNILLGILVRGCITDTTCAVKAKGIVQRYVQISQFDAANEAAWPKAVQALEAVSGTDDNPSVAAAFSSRSRATLDIFRFHMYTNTKLDTSPTSSIGSPSRLNVAASSRAV